MTRFDYLDVPNQWHHYWTKYPEGYTLLESLIGWVNQVNAMVDEYNRLSDSVKDFEGATNDKITLIKNQLNEFILSFSVDLQEKLIIILKEWQDSGFLDIVIEKSIHTEMDKLKEKNEFIPNAEFPLYIPCSTEKDYGVWDQTTHPDILYVPTKWNGYSYWMVHTPYPYTNDFYENPEIVASNDGVNWVVPTGLTNPIDKVTEEQGANGEHLSDGCLVLNSSTGQLECWYRWRNKNTGAERFYRKTSLDGVTWSERELVFSSNSLSLSPTVHYEDGAYKMYYVVQVGSGYEIQYAECSQLTIGEWTNQQKIPFQLAAGEKAAQLWHISIFKEKSNLYHLIMAEKEGSVYYASSPDGKSFVNATEIIKPSKNRGAWDSNYLYRASLTKVGDLYRLYYGGNGGSPMRWRIGLSEGKTPLTLVGSSNVQANAYRYMDRIRGATADFRDFITANVTVSSRNYVDKARLKVVDKDRAGFGIVVADQADTLEVRSDNDSKLGNMKVNQALVSEIKPNGEKIYLFGTYEVRNNGETGPYLKFLHQGKAGAGVEITKANTLGIRNDSNTAYGNMEVSGVVYSGEDVPVRTGATRYNATLGKFQGLSNSYWYNLNNYQSTPPTSPTSAGTTGDYAVDSNYVYFCHSASKWIRIPKDSTW